MAEDPHFAKARNLSDAELHQWLGFTPGSAMHAAAAAELERRRFWRNFLSHGIVSWFALFVSIVALAISAYVAFFKPAG